MPIIRSLSTAISASGLPLERGGSSVVGRDRSDHDQQHCYHQGSNGKPEAATAVDKLLMMGMRMPETCWAVFERRAIKLGDWCIWLIYLNIAIIFCFLLYLPTKPHGVTTQETITTAVKIAKIEVPKLLRMVPKYIYIYIYIYIVFFVFGHASVERWKDKRQKYLPSGFCNFNVCHTVLKNTRERRLFFEVGVKNVSVKNTIGSLFYPRAHTIRDYGRWT
jgi:hypothetical protein